MEYDVDFYESKLIAMLNCANIRLASFYTVVQVQRLLGVSKPTVRAMCDLWEPYSVAGRRIDTIESYTFAGGRRIPHHALIEFLAATSTYGAII